MKLDLGRDEPIVGTWLPDETLFSLVSRIQMIQGHPRPDILCRSLFGHPRLGSTHDFPTRVDRFVACTDGRLGQSQDIIETHTILPFYLRLASAQMAEDVLAMASSDCPGYLKARLGILASRFGASHPLKSCPVCRHEDTRIHGVSYWHRDHQWPGAWVCTQHNRVLERALGKINTTGRFHWYLPADLPFVPAAPEVALTQVQPTLWRLTKCATAFGQGRTHRSFDPARMRATYRSRLLDLKLMLPSGRVVSDGFASALSSRLGPVTSLYGFDALSADPTALAAQFLRLVRSRRLVRQPLRHILLITALFESWSDFVFAYDCTESNRRAIEGVVEPAPQSSPTPESDSLRAELVQLLQAGMSVSAAAARCDVAVATATSWGAAAGLSPKRRPKSLIPELRSLAIRRLKRGAEKKCVADAIGMTIQTVTLLLRTEPGLQSAWHAERFHKTQRVARASWKRTAERLPFPSPKVLRQAQPAVFAWLYRNDRAWLSNFAAQLPTMTRSNHATTNWQARDAELAQSIRVAALAYAQSHDQALPRLSDLCDAVQTLKRRISRLDRLPLTRDAIGVATGGKWPSR